MIRAVFFDLGGTLHTGADDAKRRFLFAGRIIRRFQQAGISLPCTQEQLVDLLAKNAESYKHYSEQTLREEKPAVIWSQWYLRGLGVTEQAVAPFAGELCYLYDHDRLVHTPRPHILETMRALNKQGIKTGIISNIISETAIPAFIREYQLTPYICSLVMSSTCGIRKPDPAIFRIAEREVGLGPKELAYVGDTISRDVIGTRNAGWAMMLQFDEPASALRDVGLSRDANKPDFLIHDMAEVVAIVNQYNQQQGGCPA